MNTSISNINLTAPPAPSDKPKAFSFSGPPVSVKKAKPTTDQADTALGHKASASGPPSDSEASAPEPKSSGPREDDLVVAISRLWASHRSQATAVKHSRTELTAMKAELAERLSDFKAILARTGRNGGWADFLRAQKIPLATADRYVERHRRTTAEAAGNLLTEEISELSPDQISALVKKMAASLTKKLKTPKSIGQFVAELSAAMSVAPEEHRGNPI